MSIFGNEFTLKSGLEITLFIVIVILVAWLMSRFLRFIVILYLKKIKVTEYETYSVFASTKHRQAVRITL